LARLLWLKPILLLIAPCSAQEIVTGFEGGPSIGEGFITPAFSIPLNTANAIIVRPTASYLYYDSRSKLGETKVTAPGASLGIGYRYTGTDVTFDIGPAIEVLWQRKKPIVGKSDRADPESERLCRGSLLFR